MELTPPDSVTVTGQYAPRNHPISARFTQYIQDLGDLNTGLHVCMLNMRASPRLLGKDLF